MSAKNDSAVVNEAIGSAFRGVSLGSGITLAQASCEGAVAYDGSCTESSTEWQRLSRSYLRDNASAVVFLDAQGWYYHLPAFMSLCISDISEWGDSDLVDTVVWGFLPPGRGRSIFVNQEAKYSLLNDAQRSAVLSFFRFLEKCNLDDDVAAVVNSLSERWR